MTRIPFYLSTIALVLATCGYSAADLAGKGKAGMADLQLAKDSVSAYQIVKPEQSAEVDDYAIAILTNFLFQKTGAIFPVVSPGQVSPTNNHIFVGLSAPALKVLGKDPLASLQDQEYVTRSAGSDIFLYGQGLHGNLHAVLDFMETTLGRRWYTSSRTYTEKLPKNPAAWELQEDQPVFTVDRNLAVKPFDRKGGFAFTYRVPVYPSIFQYQHGLNMGFSERRLEFKKAYGADPFPDGVVSLKFMPVHAHSLFSYIPPDQKVRRDLWFDWLKKNDYFKTNPDWFTLNKNGKRVVDQLCFSNPELRAELTKNILEHIRILDDQGHKDAIITVHAMDNPGEFCFCPGCQALSRQYGGPGGPIYDYLFELCAVVKARHPDTLIHTLAYRRSQTQKPPVLPAGQAFPGNLIIQFANVEDNTDADWNSPTNRPSYDDLRAWGQLTPHLWTWYYPNTYAQDGRMPNGNIERFVTDLRLMKKAGVEGVFYELDTYDTLAGNNFTELQRYLYFQLLKDIDGDVPALIREFTDYQYGSAAPLARTYLQELEAAQKAASHDTSLSAGKGITRVMTGLTHKTLRRWQGYFDRMENDTAADPRRLKNVRRLRHTLDYATLAHWNDLTKAYPAYFSDYLFIKKRLGVIPTWYAAAVEDWEILIKTAGIEKPLPAPFDGMDKALVRRFVPTRGSGDPKIVIDPDGAFGYGVVVDKPDAPFNFGFHQVDRASKDPGVLRKLPADSCAKWEKALDGTYTLQRELKAADIKPGVYQVYKLEEIEVTPACMIWFSTNSWTTQLQLGERLYSPPAPDNDNRYDVHFSLKFDGPAYGGKAKDDMVLCDQIIFVKKPVSQR